MTIEEMQRLRKEGWTHQAIAEKAGLTRQRIHQLLTYDPAVLAAKHREYARKRRGSVRTYRSRYNPEGK